MEAKALKKKFSRSGCPSTHLFYRHDLGDCCEFHFSNRMTGADMFFGSTGRVFSRDFHCVDPGHKRPEWDI
jgi:hypothetical protein